MRSGVKSPFGIVVSVSNDEHLAEDPRVRGARTKVERTRVALLAAAATSFAERGWLGSRVEDIAREAGVSTATAYNHFPTKHALMGHVYGPLIRPAIEDALSRLATPVDVVDFLDAHIRDLAQLTRRHQKLTIPFIDAVQDYTIKSGGLPDSEDRNDPRVLVPLPEAVTKAISIGQGSGIFRTYPEALDLGPNVTNLLLLRSFTRMNEEASQTAEFILTLLFGVLRPQILVDSGLVGRPFKTLP